MQNCVHPHLLPAHRRELSPCLNAHLYTMGNFFHLIKCILMSQKDLIGSLWALSAKMRRVVIRTGLRGQTLLGGQSRGGDSCWGRWGWKCLPRGQIPPVAAPEGPPGLCPCLGMRSFPIFFSLNMCGWVGRSRSDLEGFRKETTRGAAAERGPGGATPPLVAENSVCRAPGWGSCCGQMTN